MTRMALLVWIALGAAACAPRGPHGDPEAARLFSEASTLAAVSKPGARVCRRMQSGISEIDILRGVVMEAQPGRIAVRIENAGRLPHVLGNITVSPKAVVWDDPAAWTPCL